MKFLPMGMPPGATAVLFDWPRSCRMGHEAASAWEDAAWLPSHGRRLFPQGGTV